MRPWNYQQARQQAQILMEQKISHRNPRTKKNLLHHYMNIAEQLWRRWRVGPFQMKVKHLRWYFSHLKDRAPGTRYRHWLRAAEMLKALKKYADWEPHLRGRWRNPLGIPFVKNTQGRGRKSKFVVQVGPGLPPSKRDRENYTHRITDAKDDPAQGKSLSDGSGERMGRKTPRRASEKKKRLTQIA